MGNFLARTLFPTTVDHSSDFIGSPLLSALADEEARYGRSIFDYELFVDENDKEFEDQSFFKNGPTLLRGGKVSNYTEKAKLNCNAVSGLSLPANFTAITNVAILTGKFTYLR